jgi:gliding motility-associated lipoprotein GldH
MTLRTIKYIISLSFLLSLVSCGFQEVYNENVPIDRAEWVYGQAASFSVDITDTVSNHAFYINIRNDNSYRYSNLFVFLTTRFPNGNMTRDTIEFILADDAGRWLGKGWGRVKENKVQLKDNLKFPLKGTYVFMIQQAMREDTLMGITDVGLIFEKNQ